MLRPSRPAVVGLRRRAANPSASSVVHVPVCPLPAVGIHATRPRPIGFELLCWISKEQEDHGSIQNHPVQKADMATPIGPATSGTGLQRSYPKMVGDNRIVFGIDEANYDDLDALIVSQNNNNHGA